MRMTWNAPTDAKLLRGILKYAKLGKQGHKELAAYMGNGCTAIAIQKRIQRLQGNGPKDASEASPPPTPEQNEKAPSGKASTPTNRMATNGTPGSSPIGTKKRKVPADDDDEDEDSTYGSPTKRLKPGKLGKIKLETVDARVDDYV
ncbi:hypothetical protein GX50_03395 [[Emmonsia] crescens]|uniref:Uncharacterized protein n=1 Tax=[Emmonsia] crescens TaxID=73230 RepID=A0A2B7ZIM3_9EURO|nr:hypothetical protein GX50_03395 [Emmonsia crescens]